MNNKLYLRGVLFVLIVSLSFVGMVSAMGDITAFGGVGGNVSGFFEEETCLGDGNGDGVVDQADADAVAAAIGTYSCGPGDLNGDCIVNNFDALIIAQNLGNVCNCPGDLNGDFVVNGSDSDIVKRYLGGQQCTHNMGDANLDCAVNVADVALVKANLGNICELPQGSLISISRFISSTWIDNTNSMGKDIVIIDGFRNGNKFRLTLRSVSINLISNTADLLIYTTESVGTYMENGQTTSINYPEVFYVVDKVNDKITFLASAEDPIYSFSAFDINARFFVDIF